MLLIAAAQIFLKKISVVFLTNLFWRSILKEVTGKFLLMKTFNNSIRFYFSNSFAFDFRKRGGMTVAVKK